MDREWIGVMDSSPGERSVKDKQMQTTYGQANIELYTNAGVGVLGPSYGQRTLKDIQLQHAFGGAFKNVWDGNAAECYAPQRMMENYTPSPNFNSYQNPYNPYADKIKLAPLK